MQVVAVMGMPATGKTTLFREIMNQTGGELKWRWVKERLVTYHRHSKSRVIILGDYTQPGVFGGTDRLSMAVQKEAVQFIKEYAEELGTCPAVLFEGDRLCNLSLFAALEALPGVKLNVVELFAPVGVLDARHQLRNDTQTDKWLAGRVTKLANIRRARPVERRPNGTQAQLLENADRILELAGLLRKVAAKNS